MNNLIGKLVICDLDYHPLVKRDDKGLVLLIFKNELNLLLYADQIGLNTDFLVCEIDENALKDILNSNIQLLEVETY